jgi:5-methylcytosine-specific restriction endonuclease McrA
VSYLTTLEQFENYESQIKLFAKQELIQTAEQLFIKEKKIGDAILVVLGEIQHRRIYSELGFSSLFEMLVKHFKLSESTAYQKINLIKLIKEVPAAKEALLDGSASVSNLVLAQTFINEKKKSEDKVMSPVEKKEIIDHIKNKSYKQAKEQLAILNPQQALVKYKIKVINGEQVNIQCTIDKGLQEKLNSIKNLISHKNPNPTMNELMHMMADIAIEQLEKKKGIDKKSRKEKVPTYRKACVTDKSEKNTNLKIRSRYIPKNVRREAYRRAQGQCQFVSSDGKRCDCKHLLEFEHSIPFARGGENDIETIQIYCREHNALKAKLEFGVDPRKYKRSENALRI